MSSADPIVRNLEMQNHFNLSVRSKQGKRARSTHRVRNSLLHATPPETTSELSLASRSRLLRLQTLLIPSSSTAVA